MNKQQALNAFWSSFGWTAYDEASVPDDAIKLKENNGRYITFNVATAAIGEPVPMYANLWLKSSIWTAITEKANEINAAIGKGGKIIPYDDGAIWIVRSVPFAQRMRDEDDTIRRIYINVMAEFVSAD